MNQIWLRIFMVMIGGNVVKYIFINPYIWVCIDLAVFGIVYLVLKRYPFIDLKSSMSFLGGLTVISILADLEIISNLISSVLIMGLLAWMMFGRSRGSKNRPVNRHKWHK